MATISYKISLFLTLVAMLTALACGKKSDASASSPSNGGSSTGGTTTALTIAEVTGTHYAPCVPVTDNTSYGSSLNGYSFLRTITLNSDSSYSVSVFLFSGTTCLGGNEVFIWSQGGTFSLGSVMTSPSGATEILYTTSTDSMTVYGGNTGGGITTFGNGWVTSINAGCPGGPTFTSGAASSHSMAGITCNTNGLGFPQFPANGTSFYDSITLNSLTSPSTMTVYPSSSLFHPGQFSSYPTSASLVYTF